MGFCLSSKPLEKVPSRSMLGRKQVAADTLIKITVTSNYAII